MMGKQEFINTLRQALAGLAPDTVARTLAWYEQRFIDGLAAGRTEQEISEDFGDPRKIAQTLRASSTGPATPSVPVVRSPASVLRMVLVSLGLAVFNVFMVIPAAVFGALLTALYAVGIAIYFAGIVVTATGLAGVNEVAFSGPSGHYHRHHRGSDDDGGTTRVTINEGGLQVFKQKQDAGGDPSKVIHHEDTVAGRGVQVYTDLDEDSRTTQSLVGMSMVVGGIVAFLLSLVVTNYAFVGIKRYIQMNISLVKGN